MSDNVWLKSQLDKIETKIDKLDVRVDNVDVTLAKQSIILDEHQRRSLSNEENVALLRAQLHNELAPIKSHVSAVNGLMKVIGIVASLAGIAKAGFELVKGFIF